MSSKISFLFLSPACAYKTYVTWKRFQNSALFFVFLNLFGYIPG